MNSYLFFGIIVSVIVVIVAIYYYSYEGFQTASTGVDLSGAIIRSPDDFDLSGVNVKQLVHDISGTLQDITVDRRPFDSGSRLCEGLVKQITGMEESIKYYRMTTDWNNLRTTNKTLKALKKQQSELGC